MDQVLGDGRRRRRRLGHDRAPRAGLPRPAPARGAAGAARPGRRERRTQVGHHRHDRARRGARRASWSRRAACSSRRGRRRSRPTSARSPTPRDSTARRAGPATPPRSTRTDRCSPTSTSPRGRPARPPTSSRGCAARRLSGRALGDAGDAAAQDAIVASLSAGPPRRRRLQRGGGRRPAPAAGRPGLDRRPARRHPRVRRARPARLGGARGALVRPGELTAARGRAARARRGPRHRARPGAPAALRRAASGWPSAARRPPAEADGRRRRRSTPSSSRSGRPATRPLAVVRGEVDAYVHAGGQYQWDSAAPVAVARAAGLTTCRLDGSPLVYNDPDPWLPDLVVCRPELADRILAAVRPAIADTGRESAPNRCG